MNSGEPSDLTLHGGGQGFDSPRLHYISALSICKTRIVRGSQGVSERSPSAWPRPRAFASSGEDEGHFRRTLAVYAPHRNIGTAAWVRPSLILRHRFGGAALGAGKALLPRDPCRSVFLLVREPCPAGHLVSLACSYAQRLLAARIRVGRDETVVVSLGWYGTRDRMDESTRSLKRRGCVAESLPACCHHVTFGL